MNPRIFSVTRDGRVVAVIVIEPHPTIPGMERVQVAAFGDDHEQVAEDCQSMLAEAGLTAVDPMRLAPMASA